MADFFTPEQLEQLAGAEVRCDFLVQFDFATGTQCAWNGTTPLTVGGKTYQPMHGFGQIEGLGQAGAGTTSEAVTLTLSGVAKDGTDFLGPALADTDVVQQRLATVSLQLFDPEWQPVGTPIPLFRGFMQPPKVSRTAMFGVDGAVQTITLTIENIFFGRARAPYGRNTDRDQQARKPGDKFFGFVSSLLFKTIKYPDY